MTRDKPNWIKEHPLLAYSALAYAITWAMALAIAASVQGWIGLSIPNSAHFLTSYGPMLSALIVTAFVSGTTGIRELVGRMTRWQVGVRSILVAVVSPIALSLVAGVGMRVMHRSWPEWSRFGGTGEVAGLGGLAGWVYHTPTFGLGRRRVGGALPCPDCREDAVRDRPPCCCGSFGPYGTCRCLPTRRTSWQWVPSV
jgi:hypothetical protein